MFISTIAYNVTLQVLQTDGENANRGSKSGPAGYASPLRIRSNEHSYCWTSHHIVNFTYLRVFKHATNILPVTPST